MNKRKIYLFKAMVFFVIFLYPFFGGANQKKYEKVLKDIDQKIASVTQDLEPHDFNSKTKVEWLNGLYQLRVHIEKQKEKSLEQEKNSRRP